MLRIVTYPAGNGWCAGTMRYTPEPDVYYTRITKEDIDTMSWAGSEGAGNWRDGAELDRVVRCNDEPTFRGSIKKDAWTAVHERHRTYHFANGVTTSVEYPTWLWVSSSGTHYIKDANGQIHVINKAWVRITITE